MHQGNAANRMIHCMKVQAQGPSLLPLTMYRHDFYLRKMIELAAAHEETVTRLISKVDMIDVRLQRFERRRNHHVVGSRPSAQPVAVTRALELDLSLQANPRSILHVK